jgi:hypothetical protein
MDLSKWAPKAKGELLLKLLELDEESKSQADMASFLAAFGSPGGAGAEALGDAGTMPWPFDNFDNDMRRLAASMGGIKKMQQPSTSVIPGE